MPAAAVREGELPRGPVAAEAPARGAVVREVEHHVVGPHGGHDERVSPLLDEAVEEVLPRMKPPLFIAKIIILSDSGI